MPIVRHRNVFFALTGFAALLSIISLFTFGLRFGIDFTGGSLVQATYPSERPAVTEITNALDAAGISGYSIREAGESDYIVRMPNLNSAQRADLPAIVAAQSGGEIAQLTEIGPTIGTELRNKAYVALGLVLACILFFIAFAFRKVSEPVSSWIYGLIALVTLVFDVLIPLGFFAFLGQVTGVQADTLFVTAILTILGYSVHDTIVVFDRTRENLRLNHERGRKEPFEDTAGKSLQQTFVRSINTSVTTLISLAALYIFGPESTKDFALTLLVGIIAGTYSSIFFATPLLVTIERWRSNRK